MKKNTMKKNAKQEETKLDDLEVEETDEVENTESSDTTIEEEKRVSNYTVLGNIKGYKIGDKISLKNNDETRKLIKDKIIK